MGWGSVSRGGRNARIAVLATGAALLLAAAVFAAVSLAASGSSKTTTGARHAASTGAEPAWAKKASAALVRQWFPVGASPTSVTFRSGAKHSTVVLTFGKTVSCNCPAPPGASVTGRRAVFTLDNRTQQMLTFQIYDR
jgi:hypothetical protein